MKKLLDVRTLRGALVGILCVAAFFGCKRGEKAAAEAATAPAPAAVAGSAPAPAGGFVTFNDFCNAKLVHVAAHAYKIAPMTGSCFIDDQTMTPAVSMVVRRALKANNVAVTTDRSTAAYVLILAFEQSYRGRRTYTTLKGLLYENKPGNPTVWTGAAVVSSRGSAPAGTFAASQAGALMYNFQRAITTNVSRHMLESYYNRLASVGD